MFSLYNLTKDAKDELEERIISQTCQTDISIDVQEIAHNFVPTFYSDILEIVKHDLRLAGIEPELGPTLDGKNTPVNLLAGNIYEHICSELWLFLQGRRTER